MQAEDNISNHIIENYRVYSADQVAKLLRVNKQTVVEYLRVGKLFGRKIREWKIVGSEIMNFLMEGNK